MKITKIIIFFIFIFVANTAEAVFIRAEIKSIQVGATSNRVTAYLRENIRHDRCADRLAETVGAIQIRKNEPMFDEMFAGFKHAQENNEPILVLSSSGKCEGPFYFILSEPLIRFGSL